MAFPVEQVASDWIALTIAKGPASDEEHQRGWVLYDLARLDPERAWEAIVEIISRYEEADLFCEEENEAKHIVSNTAAGPLEDLLTHHGPEIIARVETRARQDRRIFWALGCVWQNSMTDQVWNRVQSAAGGISR